MEIPNEFRLKNKENRDATDEEYLLKNLFHDDTDDDLEQQQDLPVAVEVGKLKFTVQQPPDKGTLFAHQIWSGSKMMGEYIAANPDLVRGKHTIEFGAGTALPSLCSLACGSASSTITDYPDEDMLQAIRETVGLNWKNGEFANRVFVRGHEWGTEIDNLVHRHGDEEGGFDVALLSECLWNHENHEALGKSLDRLLNRETGVAIVTYCHHIPGLEKKDDAFFTLLQNKYGMTTKHVMTKSVEYMWDSSKTINSILKTVHR